MTVINQYLILRDSVLIEKVILLSYSRILDLTVLGSCPGRGKRFFLFPENVHTGSGVHQSPIQWVPGFCSGGKVAGVLF